MIGVYPEVQEYFKNSTLFSRELCLLDACRASAVWDQTKVAPLGWWQEATSALGGVMVVEDTTGALTAQDDGSTSKHPDAFVGCECSGHDSFLKFCRL